MTRVAIIGAGPCGMAQLQSFAAAASNGEQIPEIVCYEKQDDWGGLWNYTWRTGTDKYGELVHSSMYRYLWSNGPKECLEFADYTFEEHFGKVIGSYPPRAVLQNYVKGRVEKSGVRDWCRFSHAVRNVTYDENSEKFLLVIDDLKSNTLTHDQADYVVVASGHFSVPNVPYFEGFEVYNGRILHSHDFRDAGEFVGQDLLLIGTSYSAEDIASQCHKYGARSLTISHRTAPTGFHWPDNFEEVPLLMRVDAENAYFKDGSSKKVDAIILCTGYLHHFPFLESDMRLNTGNRLWPLGLYQGVVWEDNPRVMYLGMHDQFYTFNMFDVQAWYARDVMMGKISLPPLEEMRKDSAIWRAREETLEDDEQMIWFQGDYVQALLDQSDYPDFDVEATNQTFMEWEHHKHENILSFRDNAYKSLMTGNQQPKFHTPWLEALEDSMEYFVD